METFGDKARAFVYALIVHVLCIGSLFVGLMFAQSEVQELKLAGPVIDVDLVGLTQAPKPPPSRPQRVAPQPTPPKPTPEQVKPPEPTPQSPTEVQRQDRIERERVVQMAQEKAEAERAEEERHKQEQVQLEQEKKREKDIQQQLEKVRKEREAAAKNLKLQKEKLAQLEDINKQPPAKPVKALPVPEGKTAQSGSEGKDDSLQAQYFAAIQNAITNNWLRPDSAPAGLHCMIRIVQIPGGDVIAVQIGNPCNADPMTRTSIEQAVKRASPLPYKTYESVFSRDFNLNFTFDG